MTFHICRYCKKASFETPTEAMVQYGARHWAHWRCGIEKDAGAFLHKLRPAQITAIPQGLVQDYAIVRTFMRQFEVRS